MQIFKCLLLFCLISIGCGAPENEESDEQSKPEVSSNEPTTPNTATSSLNSDSNNSNADIENSLAETGTSKSANSASTTILYGQKYQGGQFHLGPVDYAESKWHNACASAKKYNATVQAAEGTLLAGLWGQIPNVDNYCDACILVNTAKGKSAVLRVVTYGVTSANSIDVSPAAFNKLNSNEYPRNMTWQFVKCADSGHLMYEFQTKANEWWTSLWVRNSRIPIKTVEMKSEKHPTWFKLARKSGDGAFTGDGLGKGRFSIKITAIDGQSITHTFQWPGAGIAGAFLIGNSNFQ